MADEDIKMLFEGDDRGLLRSFLAINGAIKQVDENLNLVGKKTKSVTAHAGEATLSFQKMFPEIAKIATGIGAWETAIKAGQLALGEFKKQIADVIRQQQEANTSYDKIHQGQISLLKPSEQRDIGAMQAFFRKNAAAAGVTQEESMSLGAAVRANAPDLSWRQAAGVGVSIAGAGWIKDKKQFADLVGNLQDTFAGKSQDDILDLATMTVDKFGGDATKAADLERLIAQAKEIGLNPEEMFAVGVNAISKGYGAEQVSSLIGMTARNIEPVKGSFGKSLTEKDRIQNQLAGMNSQQRWDWIKSNPAQAEKYFGTEVTKMLPVLKPEDISQTLGQLTNAQRYNAFSLISDEYKKQPENTPAIFEQKANSILESLVSGDPKKVAAAKARALITNTMANNPNMSVTERNMLQGVLEYSAAGDSGQFLDNSIRLAEGQRDKYSPKIKGQDLVGPYTTYRLPENYEVTNPNANNQMYQTFDAVVRELEQLRKSTEILSKKMEENTRKTEANTQATNGGGVVLPLN